MSTEVVVVDAADIDAVTAALKTSLKGEGPAVLIRDPRAGRLLTEKEPTFTNVPEGTALLISTSGSSGKPKTVALSAAALTEAARAAHERLGGEGQWLLTLPLTFIAGASVIVRSICAGTTTVVMPTGPFDADVFLECVEQMTGSRKYAALVPVQLSRVLQAVEPDSSKLEILLKLDAILIGGQSLDPATKALAEKLGVKIVRTYGSSETAGGCVYNGVPLAGVELEIDSETSEILISAPQLATCYVGDEQRTEDVFQNRNGIRWYRSGDTGTFVDGVLSVTGRMDRTIISGGLKINLNEVHKVISLNLGLSKAVVVYIPNLEWGSSPAVILEPVEGKTESEISELIIEEVVSELGRAAAPALVAYVDVLPRLSSGKPDMVAITALAASKS